MADGSDTIRFVLDGRVVEVGDVPATTTVLEYVRETLGRTGTKEGCAEGDCGACTVVIGELGASGSIEYRAINSCIRYLPTLDGHELITVESLQADEQLHPVQQSMVDRHGSQCGFCTPGFVMSLFALYLNETAPERADVVDALAGNLCRCTGYRPIVDAGCHMNDYSEPPKWSRTDSQSRERIERLQALRRTQPLSRDDFFAPRTVDELAAAFSAAPRSLLLAGGTDIGLWTTKQLRELPPIIYLGAIDELRRIERTDSALRIGAAVSLTDALNAIVAIHPALADVARRFASPPVCNSGTLCGNVANGSPIGDSMPALIVLGATIELRAGARVRTLPLDEFYLGYQKKDLQAGEFVVSVTIPAAPPALKVASYKVSKRFDQDISAVCAAFATQIEDGIVRSARIAFGGMAAIPARAKHAERALIGKPVSDATIDDAVLALTRDFQPLTDMRASSGYRATVAGNLLRRFFVESAGRAS
jgi:xanthine dehydrogenase small subunit